MEERRSQYPDYNVLTQVKEWDPHTREIVLKRLGPFPPPKFLQQGEVEMIKNIARHLTFDNRNEILDYVVFYSDEKLASEIGESERKPGVPKEKDLIRLGLKAIGDSAERIHQAKFPELDQKKQCAILAALQNGQAQGIPDWDKVLQQALFKKLTELIISAYYSHPTIWSEIGYGGPAYPRGYVRIEPGLTDPWEAKRNDS